MEARPTLGYHLTWPVPRDGPAVKEAIEQSQPAAAGNLVRKKISHDRIPQALAFRRWPVLLGISVVLIAATGAYFRWSRSRAGPQPSSGRLMMAVLPFENLTGDAGQDYFSDCPTEEMIAQLGRLDPPPPGLI